MARSAIQEVKWYSAGKRSSPRRGSCVDGGKLLALRSWSQARRRMGTAILAFSGGGWMG